MRGAANAQAASQQEAAIADDRDTQSRSCGVSPSENGDIVSEQVTNNKNAAASVITVVLALSIGYAIFRYHIAGPVLWKDFPIFILNKGLCLAAFVLLTMNFCLGPLSNLGARISQGWLNARKALGMTGFLLVMLHVLMSFLLFSPAVYGKFFAADGTLTGRA